MSDERRCPSCGALVSLDAEWCGQCLAPLVERSQARDAVTPAAPVPQGDPAAGDPAPEVAVGWPCAVCGSRNPIDADACRTCGTPFAALMREEPEQRHVAPKDAVAWSLLFPGLGHRAAGRTTDGVVRGVVFGLAFGMSVLVGFAGVRSGPAFAVFLLLLTAGLVVYVVSAVEAHRLASGADLLIPSRMLMWFLVGVIFLSIALLALAVVGASRR